MIYLTLVFISTQRIKCKIPVVRSCLSEARYSRLAFDIRAQVALEKVRRFCFIPICGQAVHVLIVGKTQL